MKLRGNFVAIAMCALSPLICLTAHAQCDGDFDGDNNVSVDELVMSVQNALTGCPTLPGPRFVNNGDGTITDNGTGLMWEEKVEGSDCLHCVIDKPTWGFAMSEWLSQLNGLAGEGEGLGGYSDWRIPPKNELETIIDLGACRPCLDPAFGASATTGLPFRLPVNQITQLSSTSGVER
jgi:hypothetical protein